MVVPEIRHWRASLFVLMFVVGLGLASWVTRTPAVRDAVEASTAEVGLILSGLYGLRSAILCVVALLVLGALTGILRGRTPTISREHPHTDRVREGAQK